MDMLMWLWLNLDSQNKPKIISLKHLYSLNLEIDLNFMNLSWSHEPWVPFPQPPPPLGPSIPMTPIPPTPTSLNPDPPYTYSPLTTLHLISSTLIPPYPHDP